MVGFPDFEWGWGKCAACHTCGTPAANYLFIYVPVAFSKDNKDLVGLKTTGCSSRLTGSRKEARAAVVVAKGQSCSESEIHMGKPIAATLRNGCSLSYSGKC